MPWSLTAPRAQRLRSLLEFAYVALGPSPAWQVLTCAPHQLAVPVLCPDCNHALLLHRGWQTDVLPPPARRTFLLGFKCALPCGWRFIVAIDEEADRG